MSYVIFDCTQFVAFHTKDHSKIESLKRQFENLGFIVYMDTEIQARKRAYFENHFKGTVFELVDQEFLGEFEDWKEVSKPSVRLREFISIIEGLAKNAWIKELKVIIVDYASEDKKADGMIKLASTANTAAKDLFSMSQWNFEVKSHVLILNF